MNDKLVARKVSFSISKKHALRLVAPLISASFDLRHVAVNIVENSTALNAQKLSADIARVESAIQSCEVWLREMRDTLPIKPQAAQP